MIYLFILTRRRSTDASVRSSARRRGDGRLQVHHRRVHLLQHPRPQPGPARPRPHRCGSRLKSPVKSSHLILPASVAGEKPFRCPHAGCAYATNDSSALIRHERVHSGETPAKCQWPGCSYAATDHSNLRRHMKAHRGERDHACTAPGCDYAATQKSTLESHNRRKHIHSRDFPCPNPACGARLSLYTSDLHNLVPPMKGFLCAPRTARTAHDVRFGQTADLTHRFVSFRIDYSAFHPSDLSTHKRTCKRANSAGEFAFVSLLPTYEDSE